MRRSPERWLAMLRRVPLWVLGVLAGLVLLFGISGLVVDRPLRGYMERRLNAALQGYTARLAAADFHPFGFGLDLEGLVLVQDAVPDPPVLQIPKLGASVQWKELVRGRLVADFEIVRPSLHLDRRHAEAEDEDRVPVQRRGWQQAVEAIYPLRVNELRVEQADFVYLDREHTRPLQLRGVDLRAENIRNVRSPERVYPSRVWARGTVFERGRLALEGQADFLAEPHLGLDARVTLEEIALDYFAPLLERRNLRVRRGRLDAVGRIEYAPAVRRYELDSLRLRGVDADYVHAAATAVREKRQAEQVKRAARRLSNHPTTEIQVRHLEVDDARIGWVNRSTDPPYRLFASGTSLDVTNFSNRFSRGEARARLRGRFMGGGTLAADARFRPERRGPDFDLDLRIEGTPLVRLNDLLRAYGRFDVVGGRFSLYSELRIADGAIRGYVKPLFQDMDVYHPEQDKGFFATVYEGLVGGVAALLENDEREEVATVADISGRVEDPETSTLQVLGNLLRNAFIDAILPGFDREAEKARD